MMKLKLGYKNMSTNQEGKYKEGRYYGFDNRFCLRFQCALIIIYTMYNVHNARNESTFLMAAIFFKVKLGE